MATGLWKKGKSVTVGLRTSVTTDVVIQRKTMIEMTLSNVHGKLQHCAGKYMGHVVRKAVFRVSDEVGHKQGCRTTDHG